MIEDPISKKMLSNFLDRKAKMIGDLPSSRSGTVSEILSGTIPQVAGVYVILDGEYQKIGETRNFAKRVSALRRENPRSLKIVAFIETTDRKQAKRLANALQRVFELKRVRDDWFNLNAEDIEFIKEYQLSTGQSPIKISISRNSANG